MTTTLSGLRLPERPDPRFWLGVFLPTGAVLLGALAVLVSWVPRLPPETALKWDMATGDVLTSGPLWLNVVSLAGPSVGMLAVLAVLKWSGKLTGWGRRMSVAILAGIAVFPALALPAVLGSQLDLTDPMLAPDPGAVLGAVAVGSVAYGVLAAVVAGSRPLAASGTANPVPPLRLAPEETAAWTRTTTAWVCLLGGGSAGLGLIAAGLVTGLWVLAIAGTVVLALGAVTGRWTVTVDRYGLTCSSLLGLGRFRMPADGAEAEVASVRGLTEFLGWGVRFGGAGSVGLVFRNGEALRVHGPAGRSLTVTVPDAATAAALFNALAARSGTGR